MSQSIRRIAVNTGGGDAPGLNAVIRSVVLAALGRGWEVVGLARGYDGLVDTSQVVNLTRDRVRGIAHLGGTILGTTNKGNPFQQPAPTDKDPKRTIDISGQLVENFRKQGFDALVAIGGDGSMRIANELGRLGVPIVGVPKTIDNDLLGTSTTFGFDTAVSIATEALGRLHSTAEAHERVMVVEVMGRYCGWIALHSGVAATSDVVLIPEIPYDIESVCRKIRERDRAGRKFSIVVVAEGAKPTGGDLAIKASGEPGREVRLGGIGERLTKEIESKTGKETRCVVLGHLQRGGTPTSYDRLLAQRFGAAAVRAVAARQFGTMVALVNDQIRPITIEEAVRDQKRVPLDCDTIQTARDLGMCLGDQ